MALAALTAGLLVTGVVGLSVTAKRTSGPVLPKAPRLPGVVVALGPEGDSTSDPHGGHRHQLAPVGSHAGQVALSVDSHGDLVTTSLAVEHPVTPALSLADGGRAVVVRASAGWAVEPLTGGTPLSLGGGVDEAAGDPGGLGAYVSVGPTGGPDRAVELRDGAIRLLASAAQIARDAGLPPDRPVRLTPVPDRAGDKVAVAASSGLGSDAALVVLDRTGRVLGSIPASTGPIAGSQVFWSPDGRSFAYTTFDSDGTALALVDSSYRVTTQGFQPDTLVTGCAWSPDSVWVLCQATSPYTSDWVLADRISIYSFPAAGQPVAWLP